MSHTRRLLDNVVPICPDCQVDLAFVCAWPVRSVWGYNEIQTYECPAHGPFFLTAQSSVHAEAAGRPVQGPDDGNRDSLTPARRRPTPVLTAGAIAVPEPDPESDPH